MSLNTIDLCAIQECMIGYRKLVDWLPVQSESELELKADRINTINHVIDLCNKELAKLSEVYQDE